MAENADCSDDGNTRSKTETQRDGILVCMPKGRSLTKYIRGNTSLDDGKSFDSGFAHILYK